MYYIHTWAFTYSHTVTWSVAGLKTCICKKKIKVKKRSGYRAYEMRETVMVASGLSVE